MKNKALLKNTNPFSHLDKVSKLIVEFSDMKLTKNTVIQLTKDQSKLEEYYQIRRDSYVKDKFMQGHFNNGRQDKYDEISDMMLVVENNKCIGGARLTSSVPHKRIPLPTESKNFNFEDTLPELPLKHCGYAEIHRFVLEPSIRAMGFLENLIWCAYLWCVEQKISYLISPSIALRTRIYKKACEKLGLFMTIRKDILIKEAKYSNVEMYLMIMDVKNQPCYDYVQHIIDRKKRATLFFEGTSRQEPSNDFGMLINNTQRYFK